MNKYLVASEVSRKQDYIFRSNKLRENMGASIIIRHVTETLPLSCIGNGRAIFESGGNSLFIFDDDIEAKDFIKKISRETLVHYPGIELFTTFEEVNYEEDIIKGIESVYKKLARKKSIRQSCFRTVGFGINEICRSTQLPVASRGVSGEVEAKEKMYGDIKNDYFNDFRNKEYPFPLEIEQICGLPDSKSVDAKRYIAVINIDGNRMGGRLRKFEERYRLKDGEDPVRHNDWYIQKLYDLSKTIRSCYEDSFRYLINSLEDKFEYLQKELLLQNSFLPIRPIIMAGDDVCFITDARIALECVDIFLTRLSSMEVEGERLNACAGFSVVKPRYPFSRAYELAEQLCRSAKDRLLEDEDYSLVDWHVSQGDISATLREMRGKDYVVGGLSLNLKPLYINKDDEYRSYRNFKAAVDRLKAGDVPRSKIKELRDIFRQGKDKSEIFIRNNRLENIITPLEGTSGDYGFAGDNVCMYFDVIEMTDFLVKVEVGG